MARIVLSRVLLPLLVGLGLAGCPKPAATVLPAPGTTPALALDAPIPFDGGVRKGQLENGLTWYIEPNAEPPNRAELRLVVQAGSVLEDESQRGLAHYVEHMAFNGSTHFEGTALVEFLESVGVSFGADLNAYTSFDETVYKLHVPTDTEGLLDQGLLVLRDWADGLTFDPGEMERERGVVLEEWRTGRSADSRLWDTVIPVLFRGTAYADRMTIGTEESLLGFDPADAVRFYRDWYRPELMAVIVAGDVDVDAVEAAIAARFSDLARHPAGPDRGWPAPPSQEDTRVVRFADPELTETSVSITSLVPEPQGQTVGDYRQFLAQNLVGLMLDERFEALRARGDGALLWGGLWRGRWTREIVSEDLTGGAAQGQALSVLEQLATEAERARRFGFLPSELDRARATLLMLLEQSERTEATSSSADVVEELTRNFLHGETVPGVVAEAELGRRFLPGITLAETNALMAKLVGPNDRTVRVSGPGTLDDLPSEAELRALLERVASAELQATEEPEDVGPLMTERPDPGTVVSERAVPEVDATEWTLSNGARVIFKRTDFAVEEVQISAFADGGLWSLPLEDRIPAQTALGITNESGLGPFDSVELERWRSGRIASSFAWIAGTAVGVRATGSSRPDDLEAAFQLLRHRLTSPRFEEAGFERARRAEADWQRSRLVDPNEVFEDALRTALWGGNPWERPQTVEDIDAMDRERSAAVYRGLFAGFGRATVVVIGDVEASDVLPHVLRYVGSLEASSPREQTDVLRRQATGSHRVDVAAGSEPKASVQWLYPVAYDGTMGDLHALETMAAALDVLLREDLREDRGGTYGAGVWIESEDEPVALARLVVTFDCDPLRVDELSAATRTQIERLRAEPLESKRVTALAEQQRRQEEERLRSNGWWRWALGHAATTEGKPEALAGWLGAYERVSADAIMEAARRIDPERRIEGVLRPAVAD